MSGTTTKEKPPNRYSPDVEERWYKYPIANYLSTQHLSKPTQIFTDTLSCNILNNVEEALADSKWAQAIQEEMEVLPKEILRLVGRLILFVPDITYYLCDQCILPM